MSRWLVLLSFICAPFAVVPAAAEESKSLLGDKLEISGEARFRIEGRDNVDFNSAVSDISSFIGTRIRLNFKFKPAKELEAFIQPQYSGVWGQLEANTNGAGVTTAPIITSGSLTDRELNLHQGYVLWRALDELHFKIGRQEMAYGDHVVIGNVGFSNVGRSFDAGLMRVPINEHRLDFFYARLAEEDGGSAGVSGDMDFAGLYASFEELWCLSEYDAYVLWLRDDRTATTANNFNFVTLGERMKHEWKKFDTRMEGAIQTGKRLGATMFAYMLDIEAGYRFHVKKGLRIAVEYNRASGDDPSTNTHTRYHALFSTPHRWLGYMDFFGRQNIQSGVFHSKIWFNDQWMASADFHSFWRVRAADVLYGLTSEAVLGGQANPPTDASLHVGEELDLILGYKPSQLVALKLMGGLLFPAAYLKSVYGDDLSYFTYLQATFTM